MKKLMILGASISQVPLIRAGARAGYETIAVSTPGDWPGFDAADRSSFTDISDPEAVLREAERLSIDGIATCCMDIGVRALGTVCEKLGLPGYGILSAEAARDKFLQKEAFRKAGVSCAAHRCVSTEEELKAACSSLGFPVVVKAVDLMGSRGIFYCAGEEEALRSFRDAMQATKKDFCLVEEFLKGTLFDGEAMIQNGKLLYFLPSNSELYRQGFVPTSIGHSVPFRESGAAEEAAVQMEKAIRALELDNTAVDCDLMLHDDGRVSVIELNARAGATCLGDIVSEVYGIDYYEALARLAMGEDVSGFFTSPRDIGCIGRMLFSDRSGTVASIRNGNGEDPHIRDLSFDVKPGDAVRRYTNGRDRIGQIILTDRTLPACEERLAEVLGKIDIEITE